MLARVVASGDVAATIEALHRQAILDPMQALPLAAFAALHARVLRSFIELATHDVTFSMFGSVCR